MNNIILVGMPAAGKSTAGVVLAKVLGYDFVDTDLIIQKKAGLRLEEIIRLKGIDGFLELENDICSHVHAECSVIATGGSVVYGREAMEHLKQTGVVVYLQADLQTLRKRLSDIQGRGVILREGQSLEDLYMERSVLYEYYADIIVPEQGSTIEDTVREICEQVDRRHMQIMERQE